MEGYLGRTSDEVKKEWGRCENRFINNLNMWKDNLKMRMNDRTVFSLKRMVLLFLFFSHFILSLVQFPNALKNLFKSSLELFVAIHQWRGLTSFSSICLLPIVLFSYRLDLLIEYFYRFLK